MNGLGASANYTWVASRIEIRPGEYSLLPSTSKNTWNAALFYKRAGFSFNLAAHSTSADLFSIGSKPSEDVYNAKRTSYGFQRELRASTELDHLFSARNLLDTPHTFYQGSPNRLIQREFYGLTYLAGVRFEY